MASITDGFTLRAGAKVKDAQGYDPNLSKAVELSTQNRLFLSKAIGDAGDAADLVAYIAAGRSLDLDVFGTTFLCYNEEMYDTDEGGQIIDKTSMPEWARIAKVLHNADARREKENAEEEAKRTSAKLGQPINQVALAEALKAIDEKYFGGKSANGKDIMADVNPAVSNMQVKITTRGLLVKQLPNGAPDWKNAKYCIVEMSKTKLTQIKAILDNPDNYRPDSNYIEVQYDYSGADKKAAGQAAAFVAVKPNAGFEATFPDSWAAEGKAKVDAIVVGTTNRDKGLYVRSRNRNLSGRSSVGEIVTKAKEYWAKNAALFASIDFEAEETQRAASDFLKNHLVDSLPAIQAQLAELAGKDGSKNEEAPATTAPAESSGSAEAPATPVQQEAAPTKASEELEKELAAMAAGAAFTGDAASTTVREAIENIPEEAIADDGDLGDL